MIRIKFFAILLTTALLGVCADIPERLKEDFFNIYYNLAVRVREIERHQVEPDQVTYYLYAKKCPTKYVELNNDNLDYLRLHPGKIVFLIHGWTGNREGIWYKELTDAFLKLDYDYVIQVDWRLPASDLYYVASINTLDVGKIIGTFIADLNANYGVDLQNILLVGFSLGGQVCGLVGKEVIKKTGVRLPRIIALDPAGPLFQERPVTQRLYEEDADEVMVIHTSGGTFGFLKNCGTVDIHVNGGFMQPGCKRLSVLMKGITNVVACDHERAWGYYIEALAAPEKFVAKRCRSWSEFLLNHCLGEKLSIGDLKTTKRGTYYLETNFEKPYGNKPKKSVLKEITSAWKIPHEKLVSLKEGMGF